MHTTALLVGAVSGAVVAGLAYAIARYTRPILVLGVIVAALLYLYLAVRARTGPAWLAAELAGVAFYTALTLRGLRGSPWWIAAGWALHVVWDVALHLAGPGRAFVPSWYPVWCGSLDLVVAAVVAYRIVRGSPAVVPASPTSPPAARGAWAPE